MEISKVTDQSDGVVPGSLFVAIPGRRLDGHRFLPQAVASGASALVVSKAVPPQPVPVFHVADSRRAFALLCGNFYSNPARKLKLIGITGTNGKTSTAYMLDHCLRANGIKTGLIGTVCTHDGNGVCNSSLTTPEPTVLHRIFAETVRNGCTHTVMEVSSQSLDQSRTAGIEFELGIFTNLSVDHLDYHGSMQAYRDAKLKLFSQCRQTLVNSDSDYAAPFLACPGAKSYSATHSADFRASRVYMTGEGVSYLASSPLGQREVFLPVWGRFSIYNSLAALSAAECLGLDLDRCVKALSTFPGVPGRLEPIRTDLPFRLLIDYAHTPDGLENVLRSLRETTSGRVIVLFGCGGDRDSTKRPEMGKVATRLAHHTIITSDNPRSEDPEEIIRQILSGVEGDAYTVVPNRTEAIRTALRMATPGDTVLLAGKGHETWQIFSDRVIQYDEREIAREILKDEGY
ncbi:MAG: UDP-N-acetylmuramoyl-L-alanyl-D-glutamate--2,6-diaminopimelate ligase [Clostridia bacterium]|nr:UDP-N-acetylmuramoyl-L-alanyl-D-glutamate--2,6-diaminopimelate ligase [Clostridia bacterium]